MARGPMPVNILLVADDPSDIALTRRALERAKLQNRVWIVQDGEAALAFLRGEGAHRGVPRPDLVLLDLTLPTLDAGDVLRRIREEPRWQRLPVVVLTPSDVDQEQLAALAADGFLSKPVDFPRLGDVIREIAGLGWAIVKLPGSASAGAAPRGASRR